MKQVLVNRENSRPFYEDTFLCHFFTLDKVKGKQRLQIKANSENMVKNNYTWSENFIVDKFMFNMVKI